MTPATYEYLLRLAAIDRAQKRAARNLTALTLGPACSTMARHEEEIRKADAAIEELQTYMPQSVAA